MDNIGKRKLVILVVLVIAVLFIWLIYQRISSGSDNNGSEAEVIQPQLSGMVVTLGHHLLEDGSAITLPGRSEPGDYK